MCARLEISTECVLLRGKFFTEAARVLRELAHPVVAAFVLITLSLAYLEEAPLSGRNRRLVGV